MCVPLDVYMSALAGVDALVIDLQWNPALCTPPKSEHLHNVDTFKCPNDSFVLFY